MSRSYVVFGKVRTLPFTTYIFIDFTHKPFQFSGSFLCRCQPPPFFPDVAVLLAGLCLLHFPDERRPVGLSIIADGLEHIRHQGQDYLFRDTMLGRTASANGDFAVLGASVLRGTLAVVGAVNIHLAAAIGTVDQPGQRCGLPKTVRIAFGVAPDALHTVEGFLVDDSLGALRICRYLAEQNIRRRDGKMISVGIINRAIQNPIYIGVLQRGASKSEVLPALKIIDENVFARAQEIISARTVQHREVPLTTRGKSLLVGNVYCGCCGARLVLTTSGRKYRRKDGTVVTGSYSSYKCCNRTLAPGKCDGQTSFSVEKLDNLVEQIVRIQLEQIQKAPPQALLEKQRSRKIDLAKVKVKRLEDEYRQKQRAYQDLRAETLKVIQGNSHFSAGLLNSLIDETAAQLKELESQVQAAEKELRDIVSGAEQVGQEYAQLVNWAGLYDNCTFESRKMIVAQFVKAVHIKRGYEVDIEFNVSFEEFQALYLEPEAEESKRKRRGREILALVENA